MIYIYYNINIYIYKSQGLKMRIYARTLATAEKIIYLENQHSSFYCRPKLFGFIKPAKTTMPPYELEQMQLDEATRKLNYRRKQKNYENNTYFKII